MSLDAINEFTKEIIALLGNNLSEMLLYGSYARGDQTENSDIDIMILVTLSDDEIRRIRDRVSDYAFELLLKYKIDISPTIKNILLCTHQS